MNTLLASFFFLLSLAHSGGDLIDPQEGICEVKTLFSAADGARGQCRGGIAGLEAKEDADSIASIFAGALLFNQPIGGWNVVDDQKSPLVLAIIDGDIETVKELIEKKEGLDDEDSLSETPLHYAAVHDRAEAALLLMEAGVELSKKSETYGSTPLSEAALFNSLKVFDLLVKEVDQKDLDEALWYAIDYGLQFSLDNMVKAVQLLTDAGADVNKVNQNGVSMRQRAADNEEVLKLLIKAGVHIENEVHDEYCLLHFVLGGAIVILAVLVFVKSRYLVGDCLYRASQLCTQAGHRLLGM